MKRLSSLLFVCAQLASSLPALAQSSASNSDLKTALRAAQQAADEKQAVALYQKLPAPRTEDDVRLLYKELQRLCTGAPANLSEADLQKLLAVTNSVAMSTAPEFHGVIVSLMKQSNVMDIPATPPEVSKTNPQAAYHQMLQYSSPIALISAAEQGRNKEALPILRKLFEKGGRAADLAGTAISRIGDPADLDLILKKMETDHSFRANLSGFGIAAIDRVMKDVDDPSIPDGDKEYIIGAIRDIGGHEALPKYEALLHNHNAFVARMAAEGLGRVAAPEDRPLLVKLLQDPDRDVRHSALGALGRMWSKENADFMISLLSSDAQESEKIEAARLLGEHRYCGAMDALKQAESDPGLRRAADEALQRLNNKTRLLPQSPVKKRSLDANQYKAWAAQYTPKIDESIKTVSDPNADPIQKNLAWNALGMSGDRRAVDYLMEIAGDPNDPERGTAISFLGQSVMSHAVIPEVEDMDMKTVTPFLRKLLNDPAIWNTPSHGQYDLTAVALYRGGDIRSVTEAVHRLLASSSTLVLTEIDVDDGTKDLFTEIGNNRANMDQARFVAGSKLARAGYKDAAIAILSDVALKGKESGPRYNSLDVLSEIGDERSRDIVTKAAAIPEMKRAADAVLGRWPGNCTGG